MISSWKGCSELSLSSTSGRANETFQVPNLNASNPHSNLTVPSTHCQISLADAYSSPFRLQLPNKATTASRTPQDPSRDHVSCRNAGSLPSPTSTLTLACPTHATLYLTTPRPSPPPPSSPNHPPPKHHPPESPPLPNTNHAPSTTTPPTPPPPPIPHLPPHNQPPRLPRLLHRRPRPLGLTPRLRQRRPPSHTPNLHHPQQNQNPRLRPHPLQRDPQPLRIPRAAVQKERREGKERGGDVGVPRGV